MSLFLFCRNGASVCEFVYGDSTRDFVIPVCNSSCEKVMFLHPSVILFTGECLPLGLEVCLPLGTWGWCIPPPKQTPAPLGRHPPRQTSPRRPLQRTVRILLECILVKIHFDFIFLLSKITQTAIDISITFEVLQCHTDCT